MLSNQTLTLRPGIVLEPSLGSKTETWRCGLAETIFHIVGSDSIWTNIDESKWFLLIATVKPVCLGESVHLLSCWLIKRWLVSESAWPLLAIELLSSDGWGLSVWGGICHLKVNEIKSSLKESNSELNWENACTSLNCTNFNNPTQLCAAARHIIEVIEG